MKNKFIKLINKDDDLNSYYYALRLRRKLADSAINTISDLTITHTLSKNRSSLFVSYQNVLLSTGAFTQ